MATQSTPTTAAEAAGSAKLRADRKLRPIQGTEEGEAIDFLPGGVFGFSYSPHTEGTPLFTYQPLMCFEVHKLADESIHYIGYMSEEDAKACAEAADAVDLTLYPAPYDKAQTLVSVEKARILRAKPVSRDNGNYLPITLASKQSR